MSNFFFYDLETSGVDPKRARIMQFAGQRTDQDLNPLGEPFNILIKLTDDVLPDPDAIMITGITPQQTLADGITEAEFVSIFMKEILRPDTTFLGFNSVRFDDEFMRYLLYRNFCDPYEWHWKDGCTRWDLLDVVRMTRALRPDGIEWPFASDGKPTNRLELLTELNKLDHANAHDALSDVRATINVARLIKDKQPKLFDYLLKCRSKKEVMALTRSGKPFVYTSGKYDAAYEKTTVVTSLGDHPDKGGVLVYDLRHDPREYLNMSAADLADRWQYSKESPLPRLPVKALRFNRCPAVAPLGVLNDENRQRLELDIEKCTAHAEKLDKGFYERILEALEILNERRATQTTMLNEKADVDSLLYEQFMNDTDRNVCKEVRSCAPSELSAYADRFSDSRMKQLMPLYIARNFPQHLNDDERTAWEDFRLLRLKAQLPRFIDRLKALGSDASLSGEKQYLLQELQLYAESIVPESLVS